MHVSKEIEKLNPDNVVAGIPDLKIENVKKEEKNSLEMLLGKIKIQQKRKDFFDNLKNQSNIHKDPPIFSVSNPKSMAQGIEDFKFNKILQKLVHEVSEEVPVYRSVRGDGNCFYRSFGLLFIEKALMEDENENIFYKIIESLLDNKEFLNFCTNEFESINHPTAIQTIFLEFLKLLYFFSKKNKKANPNEVIEKLVDLFNKSEDFDFAVVLLMRALTKKAVDDAKTSNVVKGKSVMRNCLNIMEKEISEISEWGKEAEQVAISLLSNCLGVKTVVHYLEKNQINPLEPKVLRDEHKPDEENYKFIIDLYFRPGHYDAAYDRVYADKYYLECLATGLSMREEYEKNEHKEKKPGPALVKANSEVKRIKCFHCKIERDAEDFLTFKNCQHGKICILCIIHEEKWQNSEKLACSQASCSGSLEKNIFLEKFRKFKEKEICHLCFVEEGLYFEASKCGHKFCYECLLSNSGKNNYCIFESCSGLFDNQGKRDFMRKARAVQK